MQSSAISAVDNAASVKAKGLTLIGLGGLVLSVDIPLIRLSESAFWTVLLMRGLLTFVACIAIWLVSRALSGERTPLINGRAGLLVTAIYACGACTFIVAVFNTTAANTVFILAFNPMFAALLSWAILGERPRRATIAAILATLLGVLMIIGAGLSTGNWFGNLAAFATAFFTALALTVTRASGRDMRYAATTGAIVPALIALPFVLGGGGIQSEAIGWLVLNGAVIIPVAFICLALGPSFVSAPEVSMAFLIETVLAPIWIWMIFSEAPTALSLAGGTVVVAALVSHGVWDYRSAKRRARQARLAR